MAPSSRDLLGRPCTATRGGVQGAGVYHMACRLEITPIPRVASQERYRGQTERQACISSRGHKSSDELRFHGITALLIALPVTFKKLSRGTIV
jgi:hypothetical protein